MPPDHSSGVGFTSVCVNTAIYLPWLLGQCLKNGVICKRGIAKHVSDAADMHSTGKAAIVINCTGLMSSKLGGVEDEKVYPARGQVVVVRNDPGVMSTTSGTDDGADEATYIMARAAGTLRWANLVRVETS
jgi:D-amino-acid oxidase